MAKSGNTLDLQVLEQLFLSEHKKLCITAFRITNNWESAEDIVQEVFIKFWNKRNEIKIETSPAGYLLKAVINTSLNYLESNKRVLKYREPISEVHMSRLSENTPDILESKELHARLEQALEKLPPKCRIIFILCKYEGMKYQQIADHLNLSIKTVENQMGIALQKLREDLKNVTWGNQ